MRLFGRHDGVHGDGNGRHAGRDGAVGTAVLDAPASGQRGTVSAHPVDAVGPSVLLTYDGWSVGRLLHAETRVLDALANPTLRLGTDGGVRDIERDEVLMVVPPPLTTDSPMRVAKQPLPVSVDVGVATLRGQIHVLPGVSPWETWQRSPSGFVAVTDASLEFPDGTVETADVVLVSRHAAHSGLVAD